MSEIDVEETWESVVTEELRDEQNAMGKGEEEDV